MIFLSDISNSTTSEFARPRGSKDKKPRKRKFKGVASDAFHGGLVGANAGFFGGFMARHANTKVQAIGTGVGTVGGALVGGINRYRQNNKRY